MKRFQAQVLSRACDYAEGHRHCYVSTAVVEASRGWRRPFRKASLNRLREYLNCDNVDDWGASHDCDEVCTAMWGASFA